MAVNRSFERGSADPYCLAADDASVLLRGAPWRRLVVVGDSVAAGISEPVSGYRDMDGIARAAEALKRGSGSLVYRNLGERDLRTVEIRSRQLAHALKLRPDLAIVAAGGNDILGRSFDENQLARELTLLVGPLAARGAQLVTIGLFDLARSGLVPGKYADVMTERFDHLDELTARLTAEHGGAHVDNHHHPMAADPSIFASDRIHANARGHAIAAANLTRTLATLLDQPTPASAPPGGEHLAGA